MTSLLLASLLLAGAGQAPADSAQDAVRAPEVPVRVLDPEGDLAAAAASTTGRIVLPLTSLDDTVLRPGFDASGGLRLELLTDLADVRAVALVHGRDEFVVDGKSGASVFGDLRLPRSIAVAGGGPDLVAHAARRDGVGLGVDRIRVTPPEEHGGTLLAFSLPETGIDPTRPAARAVEGTEPVALEGAADFDALWFAAPRAARAALDLPVVRDGDAQNGTTTVRIALSAEVEAALTGGASVTLVVTLPRAVPAQPRAERPAEAAPPMGSPIALVDVARAVGLSFVHLEGPPEQLDIRPTMGPGAAWGDVNGDGLLDLVLLQGAGRPECAPLADRLLLGTADGTFRDATAESGLGAGDAGMGALLADLDGDGHLDLYCANYGRDRLFLGAGDGTFKEASALLPAHDLWSASVVAADFDGDDDLDLYITSYLEYDPAKMPDAAELDIYQREDPIEMLPFAFPGQRNVFLRNTLAETGTFGLVDETEALGLLDVQGRGMQAVFWDFDLDGDQDLYIANDVSYNVLMRNEGDGTFEDVSFSTGLDDPRGGMGLAIGDVDGDGDEDLFLTNWELEANALYLNSAVQHGARKRRRASFHDSTVRSGLGRSGIGRTSWGAEFLDLDLDGALDLYVANGYTSPDYESTGICVGQPDLLFKGDGRGRFREVALTHDAERVPLAERRASRGAIGADFDRDGDVDILVTSNNGPVQLLENRSARAGRWLGVRLHRAAGHNRYGIGARVTVTLADGRTLVRTLRAGQGYLTGNPPELHFGLGAVNGESVEVEVRWPDGVTTVERVAPDAWRTIARGE